MLEYSKIKDEDLLLKIIQSIFEKSGPDEIKKYIESIFVLSAPYPKIFNYMLALNVDIHARGNKALIECCWNGYFDLVKQLVELGADIHADNECPLLISCKNGYLNIVEYLISKGANVNGRDGDIFYIATYKSLEIVKLFVENGADVNLCKNTPLSKPCIKGDFKMVNYLIECGINTNVTFSSLINHYISMGNSLLINYLVEDGENRYRYNNDVIMMAILHDSMDTIKHIVKGNIYVAQNNDLFMLACKKGNPEVVSYLIENGAIITEKGESTIAKCIEYGYKYAKTDEEKEDILETIKILIKNGADVHHSNDLPLLLSIKYSYYDIFTLLIENGADILVVDDAAKDNIMDMLKFLTSKCKRGNI